MVINGISLNIAYCEAQGLAKCFQAYADNCASEDIMDVGFNHNSGYTYIALENGITICSMLGRDVEFLVTDFGDGEEFFYDTYEEAENHEQREEENA
jgi:hypothetical protein